MTRDPETARLLKEAEELIVHLQKDKEACSDYIDELMERMYQEVDEIERLGVKIGKLEKMLEDVTEERDDVRMMLFSLRDDMQKIRDVAVNTLKNTKDKASLMNMAVKFYDVKTLADSVGFIPPLKK